MHNGRSNFQFTQWPRVWVYGAVIWVDGIICWEMRERFSVDMENLLWIASCVLRYNVWLACSQEHWLSNSSISWPCWTSVTRLPYISKIKHEKQHLFISDLLTHMVQITQCPMYQESRVVMKVQYTIKLLCEVPSRGNFRFPFSGMYWRHSLFSSTQVHEANLAPNLT